MSASCFAERLATVPGKRDKPAIILSKDARVWLGNTSDSSQTWSACELFGFGTGAFEWKVIPGGCFNF